MEKNIRAYYPFFTHNKSLIYLDNAATTQKPQAVIDALADFYLMHNAPVHRGVYALAERATDLYEQARTSVARYIDAHPDEIVFTKGTTEGINFVASAWAQNNLNPGDEIIVTELEHHSNLLPWIRLEQSQGILLKYIPIDGEGNLDYQKYPSLLTNRTKLVACTHTSNALGTRVDLDFIIQHAHNAGARVLIDAAQAAGRYDVQAHRLNADFIAFSGHKMGGPTGIGVLYIARHMHESVRPYQVGGGMVYSVDFHHATWLKPPLEYEAGTPPIEQVLGLAAAINFIEKEIDREGLKKHEAQLCGQLIEGLNQIPSLRVLGPVSDLATSGHLVSFVSDTMHPHDMAAYLDKQGICVRAGNHCAQPLHKRLGIPSSLRVSFYAYSTLDEVTFLLEQLERISKTSQL